MSKKLKRIFYKYYDKKDDTLESYIIRMCYLSYRAVAFHWKNRELHFKKNNIAIDNMLEEFKTIIEIMAYNELNIFNPKPIIENVIGNRSNL